MRHPLIQLISSLLIFAFNHNCAWSGLTIVGGEAHHDVGMIPRSQPLKIQFKIRNNGDLPVFVNDGQTDCTGCSALRFADLKIQPGADSEVTIRTNSGNVKGRHEQSFKILAMDVRGTTTLSLSLAWTVRAYLECVPSSIDLGSKLYSTTQDYQVRVDDEGLSTPVHVLKVRCPSPHIQIHSVESREPNRLIKLSVLPTAPAGDFATSITITTDYAKEPVLYVPIKGQIAGPFFIERPFVNFGVVPLGKILEQRAIIQCRFAGVQIVGVEYDHAMLDCALAADPRSYTLSVKTRPDLTEGQHRTTIRLKTTCPQQPTLDIPVLLMVRVVSSK